MKCVCCGVVLTDDEATTKDEHENYMDTCVVCQDIIEEDNVLLYLDNSPINIDFDDIDKL